jgi:hypothetical protein
MSSTFARFPSILRASAGITIFTSGPFFIYLASIAIERRPDEAKDLIGRWRAVGGEIEEEDGEGHGKQSRSKSKSKLNQTSWRLRFNSMNMASVESPDGLAIRGRALYTNNRITILPIWGETGKKFGFGFTPVQIDVAQWPRRIRQKDTVERIETDIDSIEKDLFVVSKIASINNVEREEEEIKGENDLKETCKIVAFMRE